MASELRVDKIIPTAGVPTGGGGGIIQIKQAYKTDQTTMSSTSMADISGLSVSITPKFTTSKILVTAHVYAGCDDAAVLELMRDSTVIGAGTGSGDANNSGFAMVRFTADNLGSTFSTTYLDSPSTISATTYKVRGRPTSGSNNLFINRRPSSDGYQLASSITVMEVSG